MGMKMGTLCCFYPASAQSIGQLTYIRPFVDDFSPTWVASSSCALVAGAMALLYIAGEMFDSPQLIAMPCHAHASDLRVCGLS